MSDYSEAEARANLSMLIDRAAKGEPVVITRDGKPAAMLTAAHDSISPLGWRDYLDWLSRNRIEAGGGSIDATAVVRAMRDEGH